MGTVGARAAVLVLVLGILFGTPDPARAAPEPGRSFDAVRLTSLMEECLSYRVGRDEILMGWRKEGTGEVRHWRCSSLRHMFRQDGSSGPIHDPFVDVPAFMRCVDRVVGYGFPRRLVKHPNNITLIKQYNGTSSRAIVAANELTGDIVTVYTEPRADDWSGCAHAL